MSSIALALLWFFANPAGASDELLEATGWTPATAMTASFDVGVLFRDTPEGPSAIGEGCFNQKTFTAQYESPRLVQALGTELFSSFVVEQDLELTDQCRQYLQQK